MNNGSKWTPEEEAELKRRWPSPISLPLIAQEMGRSRDALAKKARTLGLPAKVTTVGLHKKHDWPAALIEKVSALWMAGHSATDISRIASTPSRKLTRAAVIGKIARLKLKRNVQTTEATFKASGSLVAIAHVVKPSVRITRPEEPPYVGNGLKLTELGFSSCRYPLNAPRYGWGEETVFCGKVKVRGSYCESCSKMAYQPMTGDMKSKRWMRGAMRFV